MNREKGIAMFEVALFLTVMLPILVVCVLVFEIGRLNSGLREGVSTALSEFYIAGASIGKSGDSAVVVLRSVAEKLKNEMQAYDAEAVVGTLRYALTNSGEVSKIDFVSADCSVFYPALCRNGGALTGPLEERMKRYLLEHLSSLAVRDIHPVSGTPVVVTLPGQLVGVYVRMRTRCAIWLMMGLKDAGSYVDVVSPRQEVAF